VEFSDHMSRVRARARSAEAGDAADIAELVNSAYGHYVARIGRPPSPMLEDYEEIIRTREVTIVERDGAIAGVIVLTATDEGFLIENVAVRPDHQGRGIGKALLELAEVEARRAGFDSIYLYTHEKMTENRALYASRGYVQYRHGPDGDPRVYMRKQLAPPSGQPGL
jgi:N-acetylglutamate synthase-like GNAT family acetyltransferase